MNNTIRTATTKFLSVLTLLQSTPMRIPVLFALCLLAAGTVRSAEIELTLQTRDPATGKILLTTEKVDPKRVGVIAVDVWNFHWCKTATMRVDAIRAADEQGARRRPRAGHDGDALPQRRGG